MFRIALLVVAIASYAIHDGGASPVISDTSRGLGISDFDDSKDVFTQSEPAQSKEFDELGTVVQAFKTQFRGILEEIVLQTFKYLKSVFQHFKLKLLKKLGKYTLSDVFHATFDGVADFVGDSSDDSLFDILDVEPDKPTSNYGSYSYGHVAYPYFRRSV